MSKETKPRRPLTAEAKERTRAYRQTSEFKEKDKITRQTPKYKETKKLYEQRPDVREKANLKDRLRRQNPEARERDRLYRQTPEYKDRTRARQARRVSTDPLFKFKKTVRNLIYIALRRSNTAKSSKSVQILGCSIQFLKEHLEASAVKNYGFFDPNASYHIDHIIPVSSASTIDEAIKLNHYTNLQYLTPFDNISKGAKIL